MVANSLRTKILDEAPRDAATFFREFQCSIGPDNAQLAWLAEAWDDIRSDFDLSADEAYRLFPDYWKAFRGETERLAVIRLLGE
jgi:hypothetical protein